MPECYFQKTAGGILLPANDETADYLTSIKTGTFFKSKLTKPRNYKFLQKVMMFFNFCFAHWDGEKVHEFVSTPEQFDRFRKDLTILAGFYIQTIRLNGEIRTEAESLSYESMSEDRFKECYIALTNAAMKYIFKDNDELIYNKLVGFF